MEVCPLGPLHESVTRRVCEPLTLSAGLLHPSLLLNKNDVPRLLVHRTIQLYPVAPQPWFIIATQAGQGLCLESVDIYLTS